MEKKAGYSKYSKSFRKIKDTRTPSLADPQLTYSKSPHRYSSSSKTITKETDLSINYSADCHDLYSSEVLQVSARNSLIDLRCEAQMYLESSKRANKKHRASLLAQTDSLSKNVVGSEQLTQIVQNLHESMKEIKEKLESVGMKYERSEFLNKDLRESVLELQEKVVEFKMKKECECNSKCVIA